MALITLEQAVLAASGAGGIFLVATAWAVVTRSVLRVGLSLLGVALVAGVALYAVAPSFR